MDLDFQDNSHAETRYKYNDTLFSLKRGRAAFPNLTALILPAEFSIELKKQKFSIFRNHAVGMTPLFRVGVGEFPWKFVSLDCAGLGWKLWSEAINFLRPRKEARENKRMEGKARL